MTYPTLTCAQAAVPVQSEGTTLGEPTADLPKALGDPLVFTLAGGVAMPLEVQFGGSNFEDAHWDNFLGKIASYCGTGGS